jgi:hypothetical protein
MLRTVRLYFPFRLEHPTFTNVVQPTVEGRSKGNSPCCIPETVVAAVGRDKVDSSFDRLSQRSPGSTIGAPSAENAPVVVLNRPFPIYACCVQQQTSSALDDDKPANCSSNRCNSFCDVAYLIRASLIPKRRKRFGSRRLPDRMRFIRNYRGPKSL